MVNLPWVFPKAVNHITNERGIKVKTFVDVTLVFTKVISKLSWSQNFVVIRKKPNGTTKAFAECCHKFRWLNYLSLNWGSYIIFFAKTASKKMGALVFSMKSLSPGAALHLYTSTMQPSMEYSWCFYQLLGNFR